MERRTVDGVDKRHDAQRARSRASGAESNATNTTADPVAAAGGHVGGGVKVWCGERAASGRVASSASSRVGTMNFFGPLVKGRRPKHVCHLPSIVPNRYKLLDFVTDVRYGPPLFCSGCYTISEDDSPCTLTWTPSARPMQLQSQRCRQDERAERARARRTRAHSASRAHHVHNPCRSRCQRRQQHSCHQNICMLTTSRSPSSSRCRRVKVNVTKVHESERLALAARLRHPTRPSSTKRAAEHVDANIVVHASGSAASGRRRRIALLFSR